MRDGRGGIRSHAVHGDLVHVRHEVEVLTPIVETRGASEVVHRRRVHAGLREARREILVERMQPADVGQDHDAGRVGVGRASAERVEPVAVGRLEDQALAPGDARTPGDRRERRASGRFETHVVATSSVDVST